MTCNADGSAFTGAPAQWPTSCRDMPTATCAVPTPTASSGFTALSGASPANIGGTLTFTCAEATHKVTGTDSNTHTVTCNAMATGSDPWYEVKFPDPGTWPVCNPPPTAARKKRNTGKRTLWRIRMKCSFVFQQCLQKCLCTVNH